MSRPVVFVDTNCADNQSSSTEFLGNRQDLLKVSKRAKIILPKVVLDEITQHVRSYLNSQLVSLKRNPHRYLIGIEDESIEAIDVDAHVSNLIEKEVIAYEVVDIIDKEAALNKVYHHAIHGTAPFESHGDKGFKDTLVAIVVEEYMHRETNEKIFLLTKDGRLIEYFKDNPKVTTVSDYTDFDREHNDDKIDHYLTQRVIDFINEQDPFGVIQLSLEKQWLNWSDDLIGMFRDETGVIYYVRIDTAAREPIEYTSNDLGRRIKELSETLNFRSAHKNVAAISESINFLDEGSIKKVFEAFTANDQIYSIGKDTDIQQVANDLINVLEGYSLSEEAAQMRKQYSISTKTTLSEKVNLSEIPF